MNWAAAITAMDNPLPPITDEDRQFLHYNPNTDDIVAWVRSYAASARAEVLEVLRETTSALQTALDNWCSHCPDGSSYEDSDEWAECRAAWELARSLLATKP